MSDTGDLEQQEQGVGGGTQDNDTANLPGDPLGPSSGNNQQNDYYNPVTAAESGAGFGLSIVPEDPVDSSWDRDQALEKILEDEIAQYQQGQDYSQPVQPSPLGFASNQSQQPQETVDSSWIEQELSQILENEIAQGQQGQAYSQPVQSSPLGFASNQSQQPQETVDSTNLEGASSDSPSLNHENAQNQQAQKKPKAQPILSVMNLKGKPGYEKAYLLQKNAWIVSDREHRDASNVTAKKIQGPRTSSVMDMGCDSSGQPWEPHIGPMYAVLVTKLERSDAKRLREMIRNDGFNAFSLWFFSTYGRATTPRFHLGPRSQSFVSCGTREGFIIELRKHWDDSSDQRPTPLLMIVQRDGGELRVEGLQCGSFTDNNRHVRDKTFLNTVLDLFGQFEV